ncbi:DUF3397 family protein [Paenibacillus athensensis]|uniref:DUF3397 domain-containing protein n=1 Tax=Paenibacillus athensensis TaxID=1967502 RepID=A0A4Y8PRB5_9BACL|nr:DUF3397 domain-containing protein [Paenibacillus athensensis]MCD1261520.1 DUF3397 family protein [Paenibacillus athensensis]
MSAIMNVLSTMYAVLAIFPLLTFVAVWLVAYVFVKDKKMTTRLSMDITMLFLIGSVSIMWNKLFQSTFGFWLIALLLLIAFGLIGGLQTHEKGRTDLLKVTRIVWRLGFMALTCCYVILFFLNIGKNFLFST